MVTDIRRATSSRCKFIAPSLQKSYKNLNELPETKVLSKPFRQQKEQNYHSWHRKTTMRNRRAGNVTNKHENCCQQKKNLNGSLRFKLTEQFQNSNKEVKCYTFNFCAFLLGHDMDTDTCRATLSGCKFKAPSLHRNYRKNQGLSISLHFI